MDVHKALEQHANQQNLEYKRFLELDDKRESYIQEAVELCKQDLPFNTDKINLVTRDINKISLRFIPEKKYVTNEMVKEYTEKLLANH